MRFMSVGSSTTTPNLTKHETTPVRKRWLFAVPIIAFWLVMMGQLMRSEIGVRRLAGGDHAYGRLRTPTESWLGIFLAEGQRIGHVHLRQAPEARHDQIGVRMILKARMRLQLLDKNSDLDLSGSVWRPDEATSAEFEFAVRSAGFNFEVKGDVSGGELRGEMVSAGEMIPLHLPVDDGMLFSSGLGSALRFPSMEVGDEYRLDSFDPLTLSKSEARVKCTAKETLRLGETEVVTCRLKVTTGGLSSLAWIDDDGEVVRAETPIGLVLERLTPPPVGLSPAQELSDGVATSLLNRTAIRPTGQKPFRSARTMKVRLSGLDNLTLPEDRAQVSLGAGIYQLTTPSEPTSKSLSVAVTPEVRGEVPPEGDKRKVPPEGDKRKVPPEGDKREALEHLAPDAFVQSGHPKILHQATTIVDDEDDPWRRSLKIHDWVFSRLDKEPVISIPSALEVLEQRRGDCNEHTVLFAALARAASVPTRIAIGIVWSDELGGFYYHAWPEVYLDGWYWMDPTLGQTLADATHIKLLNGGTETWPRLLPYLGNLEIEVLAVE